MLPLGRGVHLIGRSDVCDLQLPDAEVSRRHAEVTVTTAGVSVRDLDSRNGTTRSGEVVDRDGDDLGPGDELRIGPNTVVLRSDLGTPVPVRPAGDGRVLVLRPAHERPARADRTLTAPTPPPDHERPRIAWIAAFVPAVAAVGLAWFLHTWQFLAFAALTPVTLLGTAAGDRWSWRSGRRRAAAEHAAATLEFGRRRADLLTAERGTGSTCTPTRRGAPGPRRVRPRRSGNDDRGIHTACTCGSVPRSGRRGPRSSRPPARRHPRAASPTCRCAPISSWVHSVSPDPTSTPARPPRPSWRSSRSRTRRATSNSSSCCPTPRTPRGTGCGGCRTGSGGPPPRATAPRC